MAADLSGGVRAASLRTALLRSDADILRALAVVIGLGWAVIFPIVGVRYELQMYGDGSLFSYAIAAQDAWAFHWHNISGRVFVYLAASLPAESYIGLTGDARGGVALYGLLFFIAPLLGLLATGAADRSPQRLIFGFACCSTACICPLVFGSPTEMWFAHAVFWPALAACHSAPKGWPGCALVLALMLALVLTHEGALILAAAIVTTLALRGTRDAAFRRGAGAFVIALLVWASIKLTLRPDPYIADVLMRLAMGVFDVAVLSSDLVLLLSCTLVSYGVASQLLSRLDPAKAALQAFWVVVAVLAAYWLWFDGALHTEDRYYLRTTLMIVTPALGLLATALALHRSGQLDPALRLLTPVLALLPRVLPLRAASRILLIVTLVHAVETAKFVGAWTDYKSALRTLAAGTASDPKLGDPRFVSSARLPAEESRLGWQSTTPFLSVLVTPDFAPARLVVDPTVNFFWISCETAAENLQAAVALPLAARELLHRYSCLHRREGYAGRREARTQAAGR